MWLDQKFAILLACQEQLPIIYVVQAKQLPWSLPIFADLHEALQVLSLANQHMRAGLQIGQKQNRLNVCFQNLPDTRPHGLD